jgi:uncharacterized protein YjiS (DUF1127 family)
MLRPRFINRLSLGGNSRPKRGIAGLVSNPRLDSTIPLAVQRSVKRPKAISACGQRGHFSLTRRALVERTVTTYDRVGADKASPRSRIGALWRITVTAIKMRGMRRRLEAFPDHLLKDIGISRSGIEPALRHGRDRSDRISSG